MRWMRGYHSTLEGLMVADSVAQVALNMYGLGHRAFHAWAFAHLG